MGRRVRGLVALVFLTASACGSTAQLGPQAVNGPAVPGSAPLAGNEGLGVPGSSQLPLPGSTALPPGGAGTTTGGVVPPVVGAAAPGVTPTTIYVGATYQTDQGATNSAIFGNDLDGGDARDYWRAAIDHLNKRGGILGRKVEPIFHQLVTASVQSIDQQFEAACQRWTQDSPHGVFAIMSGGRAVTLECAAKAGALAITAQGNSIEETFVRYPQYVEVAGMNLVRQGYVTVDGLYAQGYFGELPRIGIISWDDENRHASVDRGYVPALERRGLALATETAYVHVPQAANDIAVSSADVSAAVLRFNSENITHVFVLDGTAGVCGGGCLTTLVMREAESQSYRPMYGLNDGNTLQAGLDAGLYPHEQMVGAKAVLWLDQMDAADAGIRLNPQRERCEDIMRKRGIDLSSPSAQGLAMEACSELWFVEVAADRIKQPDIAAFMTAVNGLGDSWRSTFAYVNYYGASRHDGVAAVRASRYGESCRCMRYTTKPYRV